MSLFTYLMKTSPRHQMLHYEAGHFDKKGEWFPSVISGSLYMTYEEVMEAAEAMCERLDHVYRNRDKIRLRTKERIANANSRVEEGEQNGCA